MVVIAGEIGISRNCVTLAPVMGTTARILNRFVAALVLAVAIPFPVFCQGADTPEVDRLLGELAKPDQPGWQQIEDSIIREWSKSGSPAMDLLLKRGNEALESGDFEWLANACVMVRARVAAV